MINIIMRIQRNSVTVKQDGNSTAFGVVYNWSCVNCKPCKQWLHHQLHHSFRYLQIS